MPQCQFFFKGNNYNDEKQVFKLEKNQIIKQVSGAMKKNKLFKRENNQTTNHKSITVRDCRIVACNLNKNKLTLRNLPRPQSSNYRTPFFLAHLSGAYSEYTNTARFSYLYKLNNFIVTSCYGLLKNIGTNKVKI